MKLVSLFLSIAALTSAFFFYPKYAKKYSKLFILNSLNKDSLPPKFRKTPYLTSGSGQFSEKGLAAIKKEIPSKYSLFIIDLRQEAHGFLNGMGVSWFGQHNWYNVGMDKEEIIQKERMLLENLSKKSWAFVYHQRQYPIPHCVHSVSEEEKLAKKMGIGYYRLPVTDHRRPDDKEVDAFIELMKELSQEKNPVWLHFHCSAGRGRTTTFLTLHDIMQHAKKDSLETIISRQREGGGSNLFEITEEQEWKRNYIKERVKFIKRFYRYCQEVSDLAISWSDWKGA